MKFSALTKSKAFRPALGAALAVLCGLLLGETPLGDAWANASYDYLFRFGHRTVTNEVALVVLDNESYEKLRQNRSQHWDRSLHTRLLNKLTDDGCPLAVFDVFFLTEKNRETDTALADAMRRHGGVVLASQVADPKHPGLTAAHIQPPASNFLFAAKSTGVGKCDAETGETARRHWPFLAPGEGEFHSLGWAAAQSAGAHLDSKSERQWLRYYGENGSWETFSYQLALSKTSGYFSNKMVFIGNWPAKTDPALPEDDKFLTPYSHWNNQAVGGVEVMATTFLNLVNHDWLRRSAAWLEVLILVVTGTLLGGGLFRLSRRWACIAALVITLVVALGFVSLSYHTNYWFPWLAIAGGQVPCALAWTLLARKKENVWADSLQKFPGYTTLGEPFGEGAYGKVWLVQDAVGQFQALKEIERAKFADDAPYDREFRGIKHYSPISLRHPGLLHIAHVNRNDLQGYFYYVMELGDALDPDWEQNGGSYKPLDLAGLCKRTPGRQLPARECFRIGGALLEALDFLHHKKLAHGDIKPSNIIFVNGRSKLADVGLVRDVNLDTSWIGSDFYMPPLSEPPGTKEADIYALGKVLYVISTGKHPKSFPELPLELVEKPEFMRLNKVICQACHPDLTQRFATAAEMLTALRAAQQETNAARTE